MNSSSKALREVFKLATFDPRKPGPITAIVSCNKPEYLLERAQEFLRDAERFDGLEKRTRIRDAIAVLGYAMTLLPDVSLQENFDKLAGALTGALHSCPLCDKMVDSTKHVCKG